MDVESQNLESKHCCQELTLECLDGKSEDRVVHEHVHDLGHHFLTAFWQFLEHCLLGHDQERDEGNNKSDSEEEDYGFDKLLFLSLLIAVCIELVVLTLLCVVTLTLTLKKSTLTLLLLLFILEVICRRVLRGSLSFIVCDQLLSHLVKPAFHKLFGEYGKVDDRVV